MRTLSLEIHDRGGMRPDGGLVNGTHEFCIRFKNEEIVSRTNTPLPEVAEVLRRRGYPPETLFALVEAATNVTRVVMTLQEAGGKRTEAAPRAKARATPPAEVISVAPVRKPNRAARTKARA